MTADKWSEVTAVLCPTCGAKPTQRCLFGAISRLTHPHASRFRAAAIARAQSKEDA